MLEVKIAQYKVPVLTNKENNPALRIQLVPRNSQEVHVNRVTVRLESTGDLNDIQAVRLFATGEKGKFGSDMQFGSDQAPSSVIVFEDQLSVADTSHLWLSIQLKDKIDLMQKITVSCESVGTEDGMIEVESPVAEALRVGIALRKHLDDSVHTYRIPGLVTTNNGTLLAVYDVRRDSPRDVQGNIDVGLSRSVDGGNSWESMRIVLDMGEWGGRPQKFHGVGDVSILADRSNNNG